MYNLTNKQIKRLEELKQIHRMHDNWPGNTSHVSGLIEMVQEYFEKEFNICEIGSYRGVSSEVFAILCGTVFCVDIWNGIRNQNGPYIDDHPLSPEEDFDIMNQEYSNIIKMKTYSVDACQTFLDNSLDAIYIDGDHSFDGFTQDIINWAPKVKSNGYISGHDWDLINQWIEPFVDKEKCHVFSDDSWIFKKTNFLNYKSSSRSRIEYDFIEIGACDFDTLLQNSDGGQRGLTIEPLGKYLNNLPNKHGIEKIQAALVSDIVEQVDCYWVDSDYFEGKCEWEPGTPLPSYLKGCGSVNKPHDFHIYLPSRLDLAYAIGPEYPKYIKTYNLLTMGLVKKESVKALTFDQLISNYNIGWVKKIKIDIEGQDCILLNSILDSLIKNNLSFPEEFLFETNLHNDRNLVDQTCKRLEKLGYSIVGWNGITLDRTINDCRALLTKK
jgi:hypothetical protein